MLSESIIKKSNEKLINLYLFIASVVLAIVGATGVIFLFHRNATFRDKMKGFVKASEDWMNFDYQDLCRQRMKSKSNEKEEAECSKAGTSGACGSGSSSDSISSKLKNVDTNLANQGQQGPDVQPSPPSRSSTSSWVEEPVASNMDISTGHVILVSGTTGAF